MTLSRTTEYALRTMVFMARAPQTRFSCSTLHRSLHISEKYLERILTNLAKEGLVVSARGRSGGYRLRRNPGKIYLSDIIEATEGLEPEATCLFGFGTCPVDNRCAMHNVWARSHENLVSALRKTRLSDLVQKQIDV
jgi:Rrf2 family protein